MEPLPVELMNTVRADRDGVHDTIADPAAAARWLREAPPNAADAARAGAGSGIPGVGVGIAGWEAVAELRDLRDALRVLAAAATGDDREPAGPSAGDLATAVTVVNRACARAPSWSELHWPDPDDKDGGPERAVRTAHAPALAAVAAIAEEAVALFAGPDRALLRACHAPGCVLYFIRNHPRREWCSDGCGNRARVARHYQRHHGGSKEDG
ncbi:CGNR zinc finger domain-containing protein [Dactylosporangium maewongense]|uniref:CGNR zinc finger domain-containing protein n=1 Tax=Dactylosporangium maewongense TaxID=634393 RepID=UPI0031D6344D